MIRFPQVFTAWDGWIEGARSFKAFKTSEIDMAKFIFCIGLPSLACDIPYVFTPISSPLIFTRGPPLFPGLIAASC